MTSRSYGEGEGVKDLLMTTVHTKALVIKKRDDG